MAKKQTITSYYDYPVRSFLRNKRAYVLLACSILCMVILCASVLIYYASSYEAEVETLRRTDGPQHTQFYDLAPDTVPLYTKRPYIRHALTVPLYASADNPDEFVSFSQVYFTEYSEDAADYFYLDLVKGRKPEAFGEIIVSEDAERYFAPFVLDEEHALGVYARGNYSEVTFRVVGVFKAASAAEQYVFASPETASYLKSEDVYRQDYTVDVYLTFKGSNRTAIKQNMQKLITDLELTETDAEGNAIEIGYSDRNDMLSAVAMVRPYYEGETMLLMLLFSILPAGIALAVFIYLDMQKNLRELATLSMVGASWKQIFRMQLLKYGAIFLAVFPFGIAGAALLMWVVCRLTDRISPDRVFLWFRFDNGAMLLLFLLSAGILCGVVYYISKKMTSVAHAEMLSKSHNTGNIFVSRTSNILFAENRILDRISVLFFSRNRGVNRLFCIVVVLLVVIYAFFSQQITVEYKEAPSRAESELVDFYIYGDSEVSIVYDTMTPDTIEAIEAIEHVQNVQRHMEITDFYAYIDGLMIESDIEKQLVSNSVVNGKYGQGNSYRIWKRDITDVRLIGADSDLLHMLADADVVAGDLASLYENENTIALVVHGWAANNDKFYHPGDQLSMRTTWTEPDEEALDGERTMRGEWIDYTVGAVIYRPEDDAYDDFITVYTSAELFAEIAGFEDVYCYAVQCDNDDDETILAVREDLAALEYDYRFTVTDTHEQLREAKMQAWHTVFYIALMQSFVMIVAVLLLIAMASFMLEVRAPSMRAMYLIGAQHKQIYRMNIIEFLAASVISSVAGVLLAGVIGLFNNLGNVTVGLIWFSFLSLAALTAVNVLVPILICKQKCKDDMKL